jgi:hypothetical protein
MRRIGLLKSDLWTLKHCPFGSFLGFSAQIKYWVRTDKVPLKIRMKKARESVASGLTMKNVNCVKETYGEQRGLSV